MTEFDDATLMSGSATAASGEDDKDKCPIATLWLPDPAERRGWSIRHVWSKEEKKPERRVGFRK